MRIRKGFREITEMKRESDGPRAKRTYPIPAATVIFDSRITADQKW